MTYRAKPKGQADAIGCNFGVNIRMAVSHQTPEAFASDAVKNETDLRRAMPHYALTGVT